MADDFVADNGTVPETPEGKKKREEEERIEQENKDEEAK